MVPETLPDLSELRYGIKSFCQRRACELIRSLGSLDSSAGLASFQAGKVPESQQEWARFVPPQALEALGKKEVERQSALFEVFKSELDYVNDLRTIQDV